MVRLLAFSFSLLYKSFYDPRLHCAILLVILGWYKILGQTLKIRSCKKFKTHRKLVQKKKNEFHTMLPLLAELQGSMANSRAVLDMPSPVSWTSSTAWTISASISGFSAAICWPLSTKLAVALSTAATRTWARFDLPFFFCGDFEETKVVT